MANKDAKFKIVALGEIPQELLDKYVRNYTGARNQMLIGAGEVMGTEDRRQTNWGNPAIDNSTGINSVGLSGSISGLSVADIDLRRAAGIRVRGSKWARKFLRYANDPARVAAAAQNALEEILAFSERAYRIVGIKGQTRHLGAPQAAAWFLGGNAKYRTRNQGNAEVTLDQPELGKCIDTDRLRFYVNAIVPHAIRVLHSMIVFREANLSAAGVAAYLADENAEMDATSAGFAAAGHTVTYHVEEDSQGLNVHVTCTSQFTT